MRSTFFGIELARLGLWAQQRALDVTGHNMANANTPGYTRQVAHFQATEPYRVTAVGVHQGGQVGTGVVVSDIARVRDAFLDRQARNTTTDLHYWEHRHQILTELEAIFLEPGGQALRTSFDDWWDGLLELASNPESEGTRQSVVQRGLNLVANMQSIDQHLVAIQNNLGFTLTESVERANVMAQQIARLNNEIVRVEGGSQRANDLRDQRGLLLSQLSELFHINIVEGDNGAVRVFLGGRMLVNNDQAQLLQVEEPGGAAKAPVVSWVADGAELDIPRQGLVGSVLELMHADDGVIAGYRQTLLDMAVAFTTEMNHLHQHMDDPATDPLPPPLFVFGGNADNPVDADNLSLALWSMNLEVVGDPAKIVAGADTGENRAPGDGSRALAMAAVRNKTFGSYESYEADDGLLPGSLAPGSTLSDTYNGIIGNLGILNQEAERQGNNTQLLLHQINEQVASVSGVSMDEETANLLRFEHAYVAAARLLTAMDEMLDVLINRTGLVGR